jgi:predicted flap endonuclease-1-like 5' DNA nuclease
MCRKPSMPPGFLFAGLSLIGFSRPLATMAKEDGFPWWAWLLVIVVLIAFAAFVVWWGRRPAGGEAESALPARAEPVAPPEAGAAQAPASVPPVPGTSTAAASTLPSEPPVVSVRSAAQAGEAEPPPPDDLKLIEGIGPKLSAVLGAAGITTFAQLAAADVGHLRTILARQDLRLLRLADPTTWPEQAALAAAGQWEALEKLQGELKGGRRA